MVVKGSFKNLKDQEKNDPRKRWSSLMEEGSRLCNITEEAAFNMEDVGTGSSSNFLHDFETKMHNLGDRIRIKSDAF